MLSRHQYSTTFPLASSTSRVLVLISGRVENPLAAVPTDGFSCTQSPLQLSVYTVA
ncbi:hypothetical protein PAXRUDRAFT_429725 [Paxillus rubicundulus Ve08.2h10]|uniref:Uncharacterized protein n=1 Tax=Paxillus rubicundulus Ve08.2h10 TaxID=930991 RepID=A0A0D0DBX3_9AGAM|nr:hypothetical protein PAXRUDRAFT_429725 [Paxillus rubicundulus Ve08.2h10]